MDPLLEVFLGRRAEIVLRERAEGAREEEVA